MEPPGCVSRPALPPIWPQLCWSRPDAFTFDAMHSQVEDARFLVEDRHAHSSR
ncbi:hypothetical protein [Streptomyces sp. NBC_01481]|uniref:hypothetical protein n=1 Tax=Streptomyces sp. NBC_01481 TaxID=2975869 RepID=UPI00225B4BE8|nr:hypothetical protein [Streptomyces sp. NBC_01481]MCX4586177.1 hypothetical protein [Streptomyces sp. NBC_01481]